MSKIKLSKLDRENLDVRDLNYEDCHGIIGGMNKFDLRNEADFLKNNVSISKICEYFPHLEICKEDPGTIQPAEPLIT